MIVEIFMPKMTDFMEEGIIASWLFEEGDRVKQGQPILEVETDKAIAEIQAPASGIIKGIRAGVTQGSKVPVGETLAYIVDDISEEIPVLKPLTMTIEQAEANDDSEVQSGESTNQKPAGPVRATPVARRIAKEFGLDLNLIYGSGAGGRISEEDVRQHIESLKILAQKEKAPQITDTGKQTVITKAGREFEWLELNTVQRLTGQRMLQSVSTAPQFTLTISVDMSQSIHLQSSLSETIEKETGKRLSITAILVKAVASTLIKYPRLNSSFEEGKVKLWKEINLGVAMGTENGLIVPVIKAADGKSLSQITREINNFQEKASNIRFSPSDLTDGTFTISNLGMYGVENFNAILNSPEAAILAVGRVIPTPVATDDNRVIIEPIAQLSLTIDHRCLDGLQGARFLSDLKIYLENPYLFLYQDKEGR